MGKTTKKSKAGASDDKSKAGASAAKIKNVIDDLFSKKKGQKKILKVQPEVQKETKVKEEVKKEVKPKEVKRRYTAEGWPIYS